MMMKNNPAIELGIILLICALVIKISLIAGGIIGITACGLLLIGYGFMMNKLFDES